MLGLLQATVSNSSSAVLVCCDCMLKFLAGNHMQIKVSWFPLYSDFSHCFWAVMLMLWHMLECY